MKGFRFYADLVGTSDHGDSDPRYGDPPPKFNMRTTIAELRSVTDRGECCNVIALLLGEEHQCPDYTQEAISATFWHPDSDTSLGSVSQDYLRNCRRIPEALARKLHPRLFTRLDA